MRCESAPVFVTISLWKCGRNLRYSFGLGGDEVVLIWHVGGRYGTHLSWAPCEQCMSGTNSIGMYSIRICSVGIYSIRIYFIRALSHKDQVYRDPLYKGSIL